jgi:TPR repeat protein
LQAIESWSEVRKNCPKQSEQLYTDGAFILQFKIDNAASEKEKEVLVRDLTKLYDQFYKNFPDKAQDFEVSKAMALYDNKIEANDEIFSLLDSGFSKASKNSSNANAIYLYFTEYKNRFEKGDKKITADSVLDKYDNLNVLLTQLIVSNPSKNDEYKTAYRGIEILVKDIATCENLTAHYQKVQEVNKENSDWHLAALTTLVSKCSTQPIFFSLSQKFYLLTKTSQSAYFMAIASLKQKNFQAALQYYDESAELQTAPEEKSRTYYTIATSIVSNDNAKAKEYLNKAVIADPKNGRAYIFLSQLYANSAETCGKNDFEKKAIYFLAAQTVKKAEIASPKLKPAVDMMFADFNAKAPSPSEISKQKLNGKSFSVKCWINETIMFPSK